MRGKASVPVRLTRMEAQQTNRQLEHQIAVLAEEFDLEPEEVRHELAAIRRRTRQYGPEPVEETLRRCAEELGIDKEELWAEVQQTQARLAARGVVIL